MLRAGYLADIAAFDGNPIEIGKTRSAELLKAKVDYTIVGGKVVYRPLSSLPRPSLHAWYFFADTARQTLRRRWSDETGPSCFHADRRYRLGAKRERALEAIE